MPDSEIECKALTKDFGGFLAVNNVSFEIWHGEIFGFLGPNGSGKSTTIRMICGILEPSSGTARVAGIDVMANPESIKQRIGYMSQKFSLYDDLTVSENLEFFAGIYGLHGKPRKLRIDEVLQLVELTGERKSLVGELSTGVRQRLALAASILHSPAILILDEPTSGVDPLSRRRFWDLIVDLTTSGATILVTTHSMDEAEHCHRVAMMQSGEIAAIGSPSELRAKEIRGEVISIECEPLFLALEAIQGLEGIVDASVLGSRLHVVTEDSNLQTDGIKARLNAAGVRVFAVEASEPTLEDVFVAVAGEESR